jgi:hypothetical protein
MEITVESHYCQKSLPHESCSIFGDQVIATESSFIFAGQPKLSKIAFIFKELVLSAKYHQK